MRFTILILLTVTLLGTACSRQESSSTPAGKKGPSAHLVEMATVQRQEITPNTVRTGTLRAQREIQILSQEEGRIVALPRYAGDKVRRGELLLQLDDSLLKAELRKSEAQRRQMALDVSRLERLISQQLVSEDELARARTALAIAQADEQLLRTRLEHARVTSPFAGVISQRLAEPGDVVQSFTHVLTLTDLSSLVTTVNVSELLLPSLAVNDPVSLQIDALGDQPYPGRILRIYPSIDAATRQGVVEVALEPLPDGARPGQLCRVELTGRPQPRQIIPFAALRRDNSGEFVFTIDAAGKAQRSAVVSGMQLGDSVELLSGPEVGSPVIIKGFLGLAPGMQVQVTGTTAASS